MSALGDRIGISTGQARNALIGLRLSFCAATWVAPIPTSKLFGIDLEDNVAGPFLARLFGTRDGWLGVEALLASSEEEKRRLFTRGIAVDTADLVASVAAFRGGHLRPRAAILSAASAAAAALLGAVARG